MGGFNVDPERLARARARIAASRSTPAQGFTAAPPTQTEPEEEQSRFRRAISGFGSALEAIDRPLTERLGIRVPEMSGPLDEIVNFALQEASRPTNLAVAFGGAGAAARLGASSSRAARGLGAVIQPISRSASLPARVAAEGIVSGAGRLGAEATSTIVPEDAGPIATTISALVGGLGGAAGAAGVLRGLSRAGTREIPELTKIVNTSGNVVIAPPKLAQQVFGAQPIEVGTTDLEHLTNRISRGITRTAEIDDVGAPLIREQERLTRVANNIGIAESQRVGAKLFTAFEFEPNRVVVKVTRQSSGAPIERYRIIAAEISKSIPPPESGMTRLWRGNRAGELGQNPSFTSDLAGIALPFKEGYGGPLSYIDVPTAEANRYLSSAGVAAGVEFRLPASVAARARKIDDGVFAAAASSQPKIRTTIADIAARYPEWEPYLTPAQREAMEALRDALEPYKGVLQEVGAEVGTRPDVMEGGFYVSRGNALEEGADLPKNFGRPGKGGKITSQQEAKFVSQIEGIEKGWEYTPVENTIHSYIADVGKKTADLMTVNYLKTLTNADGERIVKAAKDLMPPYMRAKARNLKSKIRNARDRIIRETAAERVARKQATGSAKRVGAVSGELERARVKYEVQQAKLDEMILRGEIEPDLTLKAREDFVSARKALREIQAQEALLKGAEDDLRAIEVQYNKFDDILKSDASAAEKAAARKAKASLKYDELRDEWRDFAGEYKAAKAKAQQVPPGYARINMRGLEQYSFPKEIANFMNDHLARQGPNIGKNKAWVDVLENFNNIYRSFRATLDLSGAGIQTLLGGYRRPNEWRKSIGLMARTLGDERALGKFLNDFDAAAAVPSRTLAQRGLHFSSSADEFILGGTDLQRKLMALPGIKQSNRAFGGVGDAMRTMWVDAEVKSLLAKGRPLDDIIKNGDLDKIINAVNKMTGHSNTRAGGSLGDMVLFAPRFLQARLDTVAMGVKGILPGAEVDERLAAKSLAQMIGLGVLATAAINEFFGDEDIDWLSPVNDDGSYNSNFMRARIAGNDISMFGPWDSLLRAMMLTASGNPQDAVRSMASGTVSMGWDLISGETSIGEPTRDTAEQLLTTLATSTLPFASGDMFGNAQRIAGGDAGGGGLAAITDVIGVKASEMTPFERLDNAARAIHGRPWVELTGTEKAEVEQKHPELVEQYGKRVQQNAERGVTSSILTVERGKIDTKRWDTEAQLMDALSNNLISPTDFSEAIDRLQRESSIMKRTLEEFLGMEFDQTIPENRALSAYYDTYTEAEIAGGIIDWDERDRLEEALFADIAAGKYGDPVRAREMIDERRRPTHNPAIQWYYDNKKIISDSNYYGVREEEFSKMADIIGRMAGEPIDSYIGIERAIARATSEGNAGLAARLKLLKSRIDQNVSRQRERKRLLDPELDAALVQNKGLTPIRQRRR